MRNRHQEWPCRPTDLLRQYPASDLRKGLWLPMAVLSALWLSLPLCAENPPHAFELGTSGFNGPGLAYFFRPTEWIEAGAYAAGGPMFRHDEKRDYFPLGYAGTTVSTSVLLYARDIRYSRNYFLGPVVRLYPLSDLPLYVGVGAGKTNGKTVRSQEFFLTPTGSQTYTNTVTAERAFGALLTIGAHKSVSSHVALGLQIGGMRDYYQSRRFVGNSITVGTPLFPDSILVNGLLNSQHARTHNDYGLLSFFVRLTP